MTEITRTDFMKHCLTGLCSCAAIPLLPRAASADATDSEADWLKEQLDAVRIRYAKLLGILDRELPAAQKAKIMRELGRECAQQFRASTFEKYRGNIDGFLQSIQQPDGWVEKVEYDKAAGFIRITDRARKCTCPLVKSGMTPDLQCQCTLGWQEETYSAILGRPVQATLEESILRGAQRCVYRMDIT